MKRDEREALRQELYARIDRGDLDLREALRMMRAIAGTTQAEYAKLAGVSPRILMEFERGGGNPTVATLEKLFAPFGVELTLRRAPSR